MGYGVASPYDALKMGYGVASPYGALKMHGLLNFTITGDDWGFWDFYAMGSFFRLDIMNLLRRAA
jgi:hypothetical protein